MLHDLRLFLLGQPRVEWQGALLRVKRRKAMHVLAYLALNTGEHAREYLAGLFWQSATVEAARLSLRVALNELRSLLGEAAFCGGRERIGLNPSVACWVDVQDFEIFAHSRNVDDWQHALNLYRGDLLPDADDAWSSSVRAHLAQQRIAVLLHLAAHARSAANYEQAIDFARRVLQHEPANETAHQHIMVCYEVLGEREAALQQYAACLDALKRYDSTPTPQTAAIARRLKSGAADSVVGYLTNLPQPLTTFIGREAELAQVENFLVPLQRAAQPVRLLTLVGSGGSGKTRLAVQAAWELIDQYPHGVWWVDLSPLMRPEDVLPQIGAVLGLKPQPNTQYQAVLGEHLRYRKCLLILDNCEHVLAVCAKFVAFTLQNCAQVQILITSREPLRIAGEQIFMVQPLRLPNVESAAPAVLAQFDAVQLFLARARAIAPNFALTEVNAPAVLAICRQLDGIPLAIELAAARLNVLSPQQIAARLDDRFRLLSAGNRAALPRQQTLWQLIDWSYTLLDDTEKILFHRLAILPGGCTLELAAAIMPEADVFTVLTRLVEKSLLVQQPGDHETTRYRMLNSIRYFGLHRLAHAGEVNLAAGRALTFYATQLDALEMHIRRNTQPENWHILWLTEQDNLRELLHWALNYDTEKAIWLAGGLWMFWERNDLYVEADRWLQRALHASLPGDASTRRARALSGSGTMAWYLGDFERAVQLHQQAFQVYLQVGDSHGQIFSQNNLAINYLELGQAEIGLSLLAAALNAARATADVKMIAFIAVNFALIHLDRAEFDSAQAFFDEALPAARQLRDAFVMAIILHNLADLQRWRGQLDAAQHLYVESSELAEQHGYELVTLSNMWGQGWVAHTRGAGAQAVRLYVQALRGFVRLYALNWVIKTLGALALTQYVASHNHMAVRFLACARALQTTTHQSKFPDPDVQQIEQAHTALRAQLPPLQFDMHWQHGWHWNLEQALQAALNLV